MGKKRRTVRQALQALAETAYERGLSRLLAELANEFDRWQAGDVPTLDLHNKIHRYHNDGARDVWNRYREQEPNIAVALALNDGVLTRHDIPETLREEIVDKARLLREALCGSEDGGSG